jgi:hypothetical protein
LYSANILPRMRLLCFHQLHAPDLFQAIQYFVMPAYRNSNPDLAKQLHLLFQNAAIALLENSHHFVDLCIVKSQQVSAFNLLLQKRVSVEERVPQPTCTR